MISFFVSGKIGSDATVNQAGNKKALNFSVCHSEKYFDKKTGQDKEVQYWFQVVKYFDEKHEVKVAAHLKKGSSVLVSGLPKPDHYVDKDGQVHNKIVVFADRIELQ